jgi:hypothetical protein
MFIRGKNQELRKGSKYKEQNRRSSHGAHGEENKENTFSLLCALRVSA